MNTYRPTEMVRTAEASDSTARSEAHAAICAELKHLLADVFAIYLKTKNFHWHMRGPHFRDYHLLLDEHADQIFAMTDALAERARKLQGDTLRSISDIARQQRIRDNDEKDVAPEAMLQELLAVNKLLAESLRSTHSLCEQHSDFATTSLIENWIDETERRCWFLKQTFS